MEHLQYAKREFSPLSLVQNLLFLLEGKNIGPENTPEELELRKANKLMLFGHRMDAEGYWHLIDMFVVCSHNVLPKVKCILFSSRNNIGKDCTTNL